MLLHLVENHESGAVIEPAYRISAQTQTLVRVVQREVDGRRAAGVRKKVTNQRRLPGLAGARQDGDGTLDQAINERGGQAARVEGHLQTLSALLQDCKVILQWL